MGVSLGEGGAALPAGLGSKFPLQALHRQRAGLPAHPQTTAFSHLPLPSPEKTVRGADRRPRGWRWERVTLEQQRRCRTNPGCQCRAGERQGHSLRRHKGPRGLQPPDRGGVGGPSHTPGGSFVPSELSLSVTPQLSGRPWPRSPVAKREVGRAMWAQHLPLRHCPGTATPRHELPAGSPSPAPAQLQAPSSSSPDGLARLDLPREPGDRGPMPAGAWGCSEAGPRENGVALRLISPREATDRGSARGPPPHPTAHRAVLRWGSLLSTPQTPSENRNHL